MNSFSHLVIFFSFVILKYQLSFNYFIFSNESTIHKNVFVNEIHHFTI